MARVPVSRFFRAVPTTTRLGLSSNPTNITPWFVRLTRQTHPRLYSAEAASSPIPPALPKSQSRFRRFVGFTTIAILAFSAGLAYQTQKTVSRMMTVALPTDEETLTSFIPPDAISKEVEEFIRDHPLAVSLRENPAFTESRPHLKIPEQMRTRNLTAGTLAGPEKIVVPPYIFCEEGGKSLISLFYLGSNICGHPGIVHGGLLATLLDEAMGRCCFPALPNGVGVTANLSIDYRRPAMAEAYVVLRAETVKVDGRKAWVEGRIETLPEEGKEPVVLVEAKALFVEPKQAAAMSSLYKVTN
ncbi:Thioesterase/thiol ester dehydrase-isomerase [Aspergillus steynii IBT 23096]|uniref:Thioesterase/thiol ester dehydrase-isomerase n=1 Tax=Aspergillus steynii IBT 23096 TaxID=1392250 RepID=A0A2I2FT58_9EURO|nr:Thioesterase/thiol ester dehydrase-isomerase [Aspergillus steynii IBT 23096]PLB43825.1 Thioesterase/thiol ester dehydrase-isomerase [Aspergillus steynii IBT 23096]